MARSRQGDVLVGIVGTGSRRLEVKRTEIECRNYFAEGLGNGDDTRADIADKNLELLGMALPLETVYVSRLIEIPGALN